MVTFGRKGVISMDAKANEPLNFQVLFTILTFFSSPITVSLEAKIKNKKSPGRGKKAQTKVQSF